MNFKLADRGTPDTQGRRHDLPGTIAYPYWLGRLTRDGPDGGALYFLTLGVPPPLPSRVSEQMRVLVEKRTRTDSKRSASDDFLVESVVLAYIVTERPEGVRIPMLALRFSAEFDQGAHGSAVERAVRELACDGWLRIQDGKVVPDGSGQ